MNTKASNLVIKLKSALPEILSGSPVAAAYLFGSAAEGHATPLSDVDIALVVRHNLSPYDQLKLELRLEGELADRANIANADVRVINQAPLSIRGQVATQGILLYSIDEDIRIEFETTSRDEYFDYEPIARALREAFFADVRERGLHGQSRKT